MPFITRKSILTVFIVVIAALAALGGFVWSGVYNIAADEPHSSPVYAVLHTLRERSITARANKLHPPPNLTDAALVRQGSGNYDAMCSGCHLIPGLTETELSRGLYPSPPDLARNPVDPATAFWVIKHGIKASGMPAWGKSMADEPIWGMVAFLQQLPQIDADQYRAMVASSAGHSHGGAEDMPHQHSDMPVPDLPPDAADPQPASVEHRHADGTIESHPVPPTAPAEAEHEHDHDH